MIQIQPLSNISVMSYFDTAIHTVKELKSRETCGLPSQNSPTSASSRSSTSLIWTALKRRKALCIIPQETTLKRCDERCQLIQKQTLWHAPVW
jgi:hypothetical protein